MRLQQFIQVKGLDSQIHTGNNSGNNHKIHPVIPEQHISVLTCSYTLQL